MKVVSGMFGREKVHYVAPAPEKIGEEMNRFLDWFNSNVHNGYVKSAIAHLWFVCIHPSMMETDESDELLLIWHFTG